jgi:ABC-type branched-subunit amino acid transport system substrate-binding protein
MRRRSVAFGLVLLFVGTACGPKSDVAKIIRSGGSGAGGALTGGESAGGTTTDTGVATGDTGTATGATTGGTTTGTGTKTGTTTGTKTTTGGTTVVGGAADRTGIGDKEILIGLHAPVTGAAPFPQTSFEDGKDVYWKFVEKQGGLKAVGNRNGKIVFRDDQFNPATAVQKCRELVENEKVFVLVGGGGADQITACAKYASSKGVPYLSAGVNEEGLANLPGYFALSMSYAQQSPMLAQLVKNKLQKTKIGIIAADTASFNDAFESMKKSATSVGLQVVRSARIPKDADQNTAEAEISEQQKAGAEVVYVISSPTITIYLAQRAPTTYNPIFIGPGISAGLNTVAVAGCPRLNGARFLSPFPQMDAIDSMDPDYTREYNAQNSPKRADDIGLALWGLNKTLRVMFEAAGSGLSRQGLVALLESGKDIATGVYPPLKFGAGKHLGATQAHLLEAECTPQPRWKTVERFASGF